jgi:hypothetical protein
MAVRYAVANGNWSNPATWDGGTLPGNGDDVYANGKTVTIDIDLVGSNRPARLLNFAENTYGIAAGGYFQIVASSRQIGENGNPTNLEGVESATLLGISSTNSTHSITIWGDLLGQCIWDGTSATVTIRGNVTQRPVWNSSTVYKSAGLLYIYGDLQGASNSWAATSFCVNVDSLCNCTINGTIRGGSQGRACGVAVGGTATLTVNGNVIGGNYNDHGSRGIEHWGSGTVTINGNVSGGTTGSEIIGDWTQGAQGVLNLSTGLVIVNGDLRPTDTGQVAPAITNFSSGKVIVNGNVYGGRGSAMLVIQGGMAEVNGDLLWDSALSNTYAIRTYANSVCSLRGNIRYHYGTTGLPGLNLIFGRVLLRDGNNYLTQYAEDNGSGVPTGNPIYHDGLNRSRSNFPTTNHVRSGVVYGPDNEFTGTLAVPPKEAVAAGTLVDNTVGIAVLTQNDVIQAVWHGENVEAGGFTPFKALRVIAAACGGKISGSGTNQVVIKAANDSNTTRITADVDSDGNRTNVTFNV